MASPQQGDMIPSVKTGTGTLAKFPKMLFTMSSSQFSNGKSYCVFFGFIKVLSQNLTGSHPQNIIETHWESALWGIVKFCWEEKQL